MTMPRLHRDQLAVPPLVGLLSHVTRQSTFGVTVMRANHLGSTLLEEIRSKRWDETQGAPSTTLGPETGETRITYDDVDDFHGLNETPPRDSQETLIAGHEGFRQQVSVCYVASADLNTCLGSGTSNYKKITATVTDPEGRTTQLVTVFSNY
jgi:MSHA pilin protein MshD